jgi:hypothetical protein
MGVDLDLDIGIQLGQIHDKMGDLDRQLSKYRQPQPIRRDFGASVLSPASAVPNPLLVAIRNMTPAQGRMWEITDLGTYLQDGHTTSVYQSSAGINQVPLSASTVASYNNNSVGVNVSVTGGTVTVIAVNGTTTGLTSGTVYVPAGGTLTITYSVAPALSTTVTASVISDMYAGPAAGMDFPGDLQSFILSSPVPTANPLIGDHKAFCGAQDFVYAWIYNAQPSTAYSLAGTVLDWRLGDREEMVI